MPELLANEIAEPLRGKYVDLMQRIGSAESALVAFSGGVDSALLAFLAHQALGDRALAITADSPSVPRRQLEEAARFAVTLGLPHEIITTDEVDDPQYQENAGNRCFFCKTELYGKMQQMAKERGYAVVLDGTNADDGGDHRPGMTAAEQHHVRSPLLEAGMDKADIRSLSKLAELPTWDKPASACLASRVAYGIEVTSEVLARIEQGEDAVSAMGFRQFRVRHHGNLVRIEVSPDELPRALDPQMAARFVTLFKGLGYAFVSLDLEGYRSGSLNAALLQISKPAE
jgi:uncharacterized protein